MLFITYQFERGRQHALMRKLQSFIRLIIDTKWSAYRAKNKPKIYRSTNCKIAIHVFLFLQIERLIYQKWSTANHSVVETDNMKIENLSSGIQYISLNHH